MSLVYLCHNIPKNVNSIYFDSLDYSSIKQNLDGVSNKRKLELDGMMKKKLLPEIKVKRLRDKKISINQWFKYVKFPNQNNLEVIKNVINSKIKNKKIIYPLLSTHYDREYFISNNGMIRATVDYNLKSIFLKNNSQLNLVKNFSFVTILELKYLTKMDKHVRENLKEITLRLSKNSKFVNSAFETPKFYS